MTNPLITIIIPLYNKEDYIIGTLQSILTQCIEDLEIIVVDDGSTDNSLKLVEHIRDPRLKIVSQRNAGVSAARNAGIKRAKGEWLYFIDADDKMVSGALSSVYKILNNLDADILLTNFERNDYRHQVDIQRCRISQGYVKHPFFNFFVYKLKIRTGSIFVRRSIALNSQFNENISRYEDYDAFLRWIDNNKVYFIPVSMMSYNIDATEASKIDQTRYERDFIFHLDFTRGGLFYKFIMGKLLFSGYRGYPKCKLILNDRYTVFQRMYVLPEAVLFLIMKIRKLVVGH